MTLSETWAAAEREFPAAARYSIEVSRHDGDFYIGQIGRLYGDRDEGGRYRILAYCSREDAATSLAAAIEAARTAEKAGKCWLNEPLPRAEAEAA